MRKFTALLIVITFLASTALIGCDNRSQIEKDADSAAKALDKKLNN